MAFRSGVYIVPTVRSAGEFLPDLQRGRRGTVRIARHAQRPVIGLNSNVSAGVGSPQYVWLKADLAASTAACTLAMWHHPVFSSGNNGNSPQMREAWRLLMDAGADVVLNGHDHEYERFAPQDADGHVDPRGLREFVSGTGGASLADRITPQPNAEVRDNRTFGVLRLTLKSASYDWRFIPIDGQTFTDAGTASCVTR